jgi:hypothetical protein
LLYKVVNTLTFGMRPAPDMAAKVTAALRGLRPVPYVQLAAASRMRLHCGPRDLPPGGAPPRTSCQQGPSAPACSGPWTNWIMCAAMLSTSSFRAEQGRFPHAPPRPLCRHAAWPPRGSPQAMASSTASGVPSESPSEVVTLCCTKARAVRMACAIQSGGFTPGRSTCAASPPYLHQVAGRPRAAVRRPPRSAGPRGKRCATCLNAANVRCGAFLSTKRPTPRKCGGAFAGSPGRNRPMSTP